ncbi:MAG: 1-deoxy-D-xylulose-5-phosphate synthase, partial [Paludibacteraceae bacterium]|nr:1-deoxy-D-xylulose-5-phosphate synthase [Paludibacteraceae bacterium]
KDAEGPVAIRYPRGTAAEPLAASESFDPLHARLVKDGKQAAFLSIGAIGNTVAKALEGLDIAHYDMRAVKPLDTQTLDDIAAKYQTVYTAEDGVLQGGFGSAVAEYFADKGYTNTIRRFGLPDRFVTHGKPDELYHMLGLDAEGIRKQLTIDN